MRVARQLLCPYSTALVHKYWSCHNNEYLLQKDETKDLYKHFLSYALNHKSVGGDVYINAYCIMDNHVHSLMRYKNGVSSLSKVMGIANSLFGQTYN